MFAPGSVAILGATGQLGRDLVRTFADLHPISFERSVDLTDAGSLEEALERHRPSLVINTAAFHQVDRCEADPERAFAVNAFGVDRLAALCAARGIVFAHISTDYVFDGTASEPYDERAIANPLNVYGSSKLEGERLVAGHDGPHYIFRTSGLFGRHQSSSKGLTFIERMLRGAEAGTQLRVVDDIVFSPSFTGHVAPAIRRIVESGTFGLYHVTNRGFCSWYDLASEAVRQAGLSATIEATNANRAQRPRRPLFSALAHGAIERAGIEDLPDWRAGVAAYLAERSAPL
jgi:dTDP-4-dehydrorhamnose reductase